MKAALTRLLESAARRAQAAEVYFIAEEETPVRFEANQLKDVRRHESQRVFLRIFKDGRIGCSSGNDPGEVAGLVDSAVETAAFGAPAGFALPQPSTYAPVEVFDETVPAAPLDGMVALARDVIARLTGHTPGLLCEGGIARESATVTIMNSNGLDVSYRKSIFGLAMSGLLTRGTDMLFTGDSHYSCRLFENSDALVDSIIRQLDRAGDIAPAPTRRLPVVFTPLGVASALVAPLMAGFNGKMVLEKASPLADKLGHRLLDQGFSLYDDTTLPFEPSSRPFDDEGVPSRRLPLVENGVVRSFYYDLKTAAAAGTVSTGHARRGRQEPEPAPGAFVIPAGKVPFDDMIAGLKEGLVVEQVMGATQGNILGGDFSGNVLLGYMVEHGRIIGRVKNTVVFGNVYALFKDIAALGADGRWVDGHLFTPSICFPAISVASKV